MRPLPRDTKERFSDKLDILLGCCGAERSARRWVSYARGIHFGREKGGRTRTRMYARMWTDGRTEKLEGREPETLTK